MNRINKIYKCLLSIILLLSMTNCTSDFEKLNTNPNDSKSATPNLLIPGILRQITYDWSDYGWSGGSLVVQYVSRLQFTSDDRYDWGPAGDPYNAGYDALRDVSSIIESTKEDALQKNYYGVGLVLKSWIYSIMVDAYGDIPYSEATLGKLEGNFTPIFDKQNTVYEGILNDLELANEVLADADNIDGDILYGGNVAKWRKFANSLRLRLLMRTTDVTNATSVAAMQAIVSNPSQYPIFESNDDMAVIQWNTENPQPNFTTRSGSFDEIRLSNTMETRMKALNDTRLKVFAQPTSDSKAGIYSNNWDDYVGMPNGLNDTDALNYNGGSNFISRVGVLFSCDACNEVASATAAQTIIMSYSELQFILAEARERSMISTGTTEAYYQNGIRTSFEYYKSRIDAGGWADISNDLQNKIDNMDDFLSQNDVALTGSGSDDLNKIYLQKWIALFNTGFEAWSDWRRTNQPEIVPGPDNVNSDKVPVRFQYPNDVKSTNNANYKAAVASMGGDNINTRLWWDVSDNN